MACAYLTADGWVETAGPFTIGEGEAAISYPASWAGAPTVEIVETDQPTDVIITGSTIATINGAPTRQWNSTEILLGDLKTDLKRQAQAIRDVYVNGGCETSHGRVDTDRESRLNISGSVQLAGIFGAAFTIDWRKTDNSLVTLDQAGMVAVGVAAGQHVAICYGACFAIKDAIDAAPSAAAARAIDLHAGYPA